MTTTTPNTAEPRRSARERLLDAASELFYNEGVQSVGIDRIIEHAGVAKASLYNTFGSKEELVQAYLASRHTGTVERLTAAIEKHQDPRDRLLAVFDAQAELAAQPNFRGCAFIRLALRRRLEGSSSRRLMTIAPTSARCSPNSPSRPGRPSPLRLPASYT